MIESEPRDGLIKDIMDVDESPRVPSWFLRDYVRTSDELERTPPALTISNTEGKGKQDVNNGSSEGLYEMDATFFESMCRVIRPTSSNTVNGDGGFFTKNALLLHYLNRSSWDNYGWRFLASVVEYFATTINADLITITLDVAIALVLHTIERTGAQAPAGINDLVNWAFSVDGAAPPSSDETKAAQERQDKGRKSQSSAKGVNFSFHDVLSAPRLKAHRSSIGTARHSNRPLVVHLPKISNLHAAAQGAILNRLRSDAFQSQIQHCSTNIIFIATDIENPLTSLNPAILGLLGTNPTAKPLRLVPLSSPAQKALLVKHGEFRDSGSMRKHRLANIRAVKMAMRDQYSETSAGSLADAEVDWEFLDNTRAGEIFDKEILSAVDIDDIVQEIGEDFDSASVQDSILRIGRREEILDAWKSGLSGDAADEQTSSPTDKWSGFPENIRKTINEILADKEKYKRESEFLDLIVLPNEVEDGWDDIALDHETKEGIQQILPGAESTSVNQSGYGILKRGRIGGALMYGPPGTGKTHLARVIAKECKAVTICASGADIEDMYVGETEKIIKGLFNLGKMLVPSIIFIDEADALFRARQPGERSYKRSQTNQLLAEMDGLSRSKSSPFVLLATNFPNDLDHALLRRVPSRIYIGLPSVEMREVILGIMLKEETLGPDLDLSRLALMTSRFSGSDIQSLCVQAALICDVFADEKGVKGRRILSQAHFTKALKRVSPTTSRKGLVLIKHFANEFDPPGYERLIAMEEREGTALLREGGDAVGHMDPRQMVI
ncbi:AAA-domain-containing protein [Thozetella sp. PMI_491]|nr:AAA-domain-containing protein [Thozetella sp. PMI_491]